MKYLKFIQSFLFLSFLVTLSSAAKKPNIVLIYIDDMGWTDVASNKKEFTEPFYETPTIDKLAEEGMTFKYGYANAGNCAPSRAALVSGQYSPRTGVYTVKDSDRGNKKDHKLIPPKNTVVLNPKHVTMAEALKAAGYKTAHMGKWHLGNTPETSPENQGFDINIGGTIAGSPPGGYFGPWRAPGLEGGPKDEYMTDRLTDEAIKFMTTNKSNPFFIFLSHYAVHTPIQAKDEYVKYFQNKAKGDFSKYKKYATYAAMVKILDENIARLLKSLKDLDLEDNTLIVFTSDNGGSVNGTSNAPLRGAKGVLYEGGVREPFIMKWPGRTKPGSVTNVPVIATDLYPTFLDAAGAPAPKDYPLDGESLLPLLDGKPLKRDAIFFYYPVYLPGRNTPSNGIRMGPYKLLEFFEYNMLEVYDIENDLTEKKNIALTNPAVTLRLYNRLEKWRKNIGAKVITEQNPVYSPDPKKVPKPEKIITLEKVKQAAKEMGIDPTNLSLEKKRPSLNKHSMKAPKSNKGLQSGLRATEERDYKGSLNSL